MHLLTKFISPIIIFLAFFKSYASKQYEYFIDLKESYALPKFKILKEADNENYPKTLSHKKTNLTSFAIGHNINSNWNMLLEYSFLSNFYSRLSEYYTTNSGANKNYYYLISSQSAKRLALEFEYNVFTYNHFSNYLNFGLGVSLNRLNDFNTYINQYDSHGDLTGNALSTMNFGANNFSFSYNLGLGIAYKYNERISILAGYKFISFGTFKSSNITYSAGGPTPNLNNNIPGELIFDTSPFYKFRLYTHSFMMGVRVAI